MLRVIGSWRFLAHMHQARLPRIRSNFIRAVEPTSSMASGLKSRKCKYAGGYVLAVGFQSFGGLRVSGRKMPQRLAWAWLGAVCSWDRRVTVG